MNTTDYSSVRVSRATFERIDDHKREDESKGDVIDRALDALEGDVVEFELIGLAENYQEPPIVWEVWATDDGRWGTTRVSDPTSNILHPTLKDGEP